VPPGWVCLDGTAANCAALPLLLPAYALPLTLTDTVAAGPTSFGLSIPHAQGTASPAAIAGVTVSVSYDDGGSWQPALVTPTASGQYQVSYTTPVASATNGFVALRTTAWDAAGSRVTQTILRAYQLGS
jgi:hypothetical protein